MTRNPSCCVPSDSVAAAARIMKQQDVGPVLVVSDHSSKRLRGIVTDRDIAIQVAAEGRDPDRTRVEQIMTSDPVTCKEDDDVTNAVRIMAEYQVRRIPVLDDEGALTGIISQADIARHSDESQVGEMVEEISQPWGSGEWNGQAVTSSAQSSSGGLDAASAVAIGALCLGFGAALMYMFDPAKGHKRRARLADRSSDMWQHRSEVLQKTKEAITDRAQNLVTATRQKFGSEQPVEGAEPHTP